MSSIADSLREARRLWAAPKSPLPAWAREAALGGFPAGAAWMRKTLAWLRGEPIGEGPVQPVEHDEARFRGLGYLKYGLALLVAALPVAVAIRLDSPWPLVLVPGLFYFVETRMLFLFPLVVDGDPAPFRNGLDLVRRLGPAPLVSARVFVLAVTMVLGGLVGRGVVRSWGLGCLVVLLWYEELRLTESGAHG